MSGAGISLHFVVEGQSEEAFVNRLLRDHLAASNVWTYARCVYTSKDGPYWRRGGVTSYERLRRDLRAWLSQDRRPESRFTTMIDLYRLGDDFPGVPEARACPRAGERAAFVEDAIAKDIGDHRLLPYVQLHEFEALILSQPAKLATMYPGADLSALVELVSQVPPEHVDLGQPPSKRIAALIPEYDKVAAAVQVLLAIGLPTVRGACPHFAGWLDRLQRLAAGG